MDMSDAVFAYRLCAYAYLTAWGNGNEYRDRPLIIGKGVI